METVILWCGFTTLIVAALSFDLFVLQRKSHEVGLREALIWSASWILLGLMFGVVIFLVRGRESGLEYLTGYVIEKSLSIDNVFVFLLIFQYFDVPARIQPKALRWGITGALVMRLILILVGAALLETFHWMIFVFGALLLLAALRLALQKEGKMNPESNPVVGLVRRFLPVSADFHGDRFITRLDGRFVATPLLVVVLVIESTDLVFAADSIPAILAITTDPFIVFTSNAFAILGLRALYFAIAAIVSRFVYLRQGLVAVLGFIGVKMLISDAYEISTATSLAAVSAILGVSVALSLLAKRRKWSPQGPAAGDPEVKPTPAVVERDGDDGASHPE